MSKDFRINKKICLCSAAALILGAQVVCASDDQFQNNLLKMDVYKTSQGGVKVNLYTTKPYKDNVIVNKKSDQEYVILMPETVSSMTSKPSAKSAPDVLTNIEVKTQQYGTTQGQKGYTKITISTSKAVEITPQVQTVNVSGYRLSEQEAKELLQRAGKKQAGASVGQKQAGAPKSAVSKRVASQSEKKLAQRPASKQTQAVSKRTESKNESKRALAAAEKKVVQAPVSAQKPIQKQVQKVVKVPEKAAVDEVKSIQNGGASAPVEEAKMPTTGEGIPAGETKVAETGSQTGQTGEQLSEQVGEKAGTEPVAAPAVPTGGRFGKYQKYVNLIKANKELISYSLIPILILLLILSVIRRNKSQNRPNQKTQNMFAQTAGKSSAAGVETPSSAGMGGEFLDEGADWKEKFKAYKNQTPVYSDIQKDEEEIQTEGQEEPFGVDMADVTEDLFAEEEPAYELEQIFEEKDSLIESLDESVSEEVGQAAGESAQEEIYSESEQYQEVVGEESPEVEPFPEFGTQQEALLESGFSTEDEMTDWGDFGEEETLEEASIDEVFEDEVEEEPLGFNIYENSEETTFENPLMGQGFQQTPGFEPEYGGFGTVSVQAPPEAQTALLEDEIEENLLEQELGLSKKSGFSIDATKGLYLIDYEDTTALVGYIGEDVFVLKRFDSPVKGKLQARMSEHTGNAATYIAKVGNFKALIEVTPEKMGLLLEL